MRFMLVSNLVKPCISLLKSNQSAEASMYIVLMDKTTKGTLEAQRAQCRSVDSENTGGEVERCRSEGWWMIGGGAGARDGG